MKSTNKVLLITDELDWYELRVKQAKEYVESIDLSNLKDRVEFKRTANGGMLPMVIASKEAQAKSYMDIMEKIPKLLTALDDLRNKYKDKLPETKGREEISDFMEDEMLADD